MMIKIRELVSAHKIFFYVVGSLIFTFIFLVMSWKLPISWGFPLVMLIYSIFTGMKIIRGDFMKKKKENGKKIFKDVMENEKRTKRIPEPVLEKPDTIVSDDSVADGLGIKDFDDSGRVDEPKVAPINKKLDIKAFPEKRDIAEILEEIKSHQDAILRLKIELIGLI